MRGRLAIARGSRAIRDNDQATRDGSREFPEIRVSTPQTLSIPERGFLRGEGKQYACPSGCVKEFREDMDFSGNKEFRRNRDFIRI